MTSSFMHWTKENGDPMTYGDSTDFTPVPRRTYRCKAKAGVRAQANNQVIHKHPCKLTIDHDGDHQCVCSKKWERAES